MKATFSKTTIANKETEVIMRSLIRKQFDTIPEGAFWMEEEKSNLVQAAYDLGLDDLAEEMINDSKI